MAQQTAVEKLFEQVCNLDWKNLTGDEKLQLFEQAKEMEKEQIMDAHNQGYADGYRDNRNSPIDYYNETYGSKI